MALARAERGDRVVVIGSNPDKGRRTVTDAYRIGAGDRFDFI
ncbi:hypothetical protein [Nocardia brevicatena]|nr:hypothetical protein [Nocardia brevicatena]